MTEADHEKKDNSPRATGPAGAAFEARVAAHYALSVLSQTEAFGLPGIVVKTIEFQRCNLGHPLDDIVVKGESDGKTQCLEIQVKRSISFTENSEVFSDIVKRIVESRKIDPSRKFCVAIERTSQPIEIGVQEVLELSRHSLNISNFNTLLEKPGRGNSHMTAFVKAFKKHLSENGIEDEEILFEILKSFSVLTFDFARPNSIAEQHDRNRAKQLTNQSSDISLYDSLINWLLDVDSTGGETDREHIIAALRSKGIEIQSSISLSKARDRIFEMGHYALNEIETTICNHHLTRSKLRQEIEQLITEAESGVIEITGPGGVGKSGLLKTIVQSRQRNSRILVLAPDRTPSGGWSALRADFSIDVSAKDFFLDLACDGGIIVFIDGLDRFHDQGQRKTVVDVISTVIDIEGISLLYTARTGWDAEGGSLLGEDLMNSFKARKQLIVEGLDDNEAEDLSKAVPSLSKLLDYNHPAKNLARNPFILKRLLSTRLNTDELISEAELAWDWWISGAHSSSKASSGEALSRRRALLCLAKSMISNSLVVDISSEDSEAVATLLSEKVLVQISTDLVKYQHDLFADWAVACAISEDNNNIVKLPLGSHPPLWLSRGFELAFRRFAEGDVERAWLDNIQILKDNGAKTGWIGLALLALMRSERATELLTKHEDLLIDPDNSDILAGVIRRVIASHSQNLKSLLKDVAPSEIKIPKDLVVPDGPQWLQLLLWCISKFDQLPASALPAVIDLFEGWLPISIFGERRVSQQILERLADVLISNIETYRQPFSQLDKKIRYSVGDNSLSTARYQLAMYAFIAPDAVNRYLNAVSESSPMGSELCLLLEFPGHIPKACPESLSRAIQSVVHDDSQEDRKHKRRDSAWLSHLEDVFVLGKSGISLFSDILESDRQVGISLIRFLVTSVEETYEYENIFVFDLLGKERSISTKFSYGWPRGNGPSRMVFKALQALENFAHNCIKDEEPLVDVINWIIGDEPIGGAFLAVIVDLILSHASLDDDVLHEIVTSPELLVLDYSRYQSDMLELMSNSSMTSLLNSCPNDKSVIEKLRNQNSRRIALHGVIPQIVFRVTEEKIDPIRSKLESGVTRLGEWTSEIVNWNSPIFMASHALWVTLKDNYYEIAEKDSSGDTRKGWSILWPEDQWKWLQTQSSDSAIESEKFSRSLSIRTSMDDESNPVKCTVEDALKILDDTSEAKITINNEHDVNDRWIIRVAAAAFVARFGDESVIEKHRPVIKEIFRRTLMEKPRDLDSIRYDVMYSPHALSITGILYLYSRFNDKIDVGKLLSSANRYSSATVSALIHHITSADNLDEKLFCSLVRIGIQSCSSPRRKGYDEKDVLFEKRIERLNQLKSSQMAIELDFIENDSEEPNWPTPPFETPSKSNDGARLSGKFKKHEPPDFYFDHRTGSAWIQLLAKSSISDSKLAARFVQDNKSWLIENASSEDDGDLYSDWTRSVFEYMAVHAKNWLEKDRNELIFGVLKQFSTEAFLDGAAAFLVKSDLSMIEGNSTDTEYLLKIREELWTILKDNKRWKQHLWSARNGMEIHLKELVAAFFCKISHGFGQDTSYTKGLVDSQLTPFLPLLTEITMTSGACPTIALLYLDIIELIDPSISVPYLLQSATSWSDNDSQRFWNEFGIGNRVCKILETTEPKNLDPKWEEIADSIASTGVTAGENLKRSIQILRQ